MAIAASTLARSSGTATDPSGRSFSVTSSRSRRSTSARGLVQRRSYSTGMRRSRISRMSRKPRVVISAVRAPLPSSTVLEPTVVPCSTSVTAGAVGQQGAQALDDALAVVVRGGGDLVRPHRARRRRCDEIGERAADIDADAQKSCPASPSLRARTTLRGRPARQGASFKRWSSQRGSGWRVRRGDTASPAAARPAARRSMRTWLA